MPIEYSDKNVIYTGEDNEFLGIKSGDSYNTVINKIISNNKKESSPADTNSIVFPGISRASTTSCEGEILNQKIYYSLSEDGFLSYSAKEMISQLKAGYYFLQIVAPKAFVRQDIRATYFREKLPAVVFTIYV